LGGLTAAPSRLVRPPRVKESPVAFECRHWRTIDLPPAVPGGKEGYSVVFGLVIGIHIDDSVTRNGMVDSAAMRPIARLGYMDYTVVTPETVFTIQRPTVDTAGHVVERKAAR
jgi:flavin reductase (DIM6/NTAB) family NADH-FMN oxidoreductase RutF